MIFTYEFELVGVIEVHAVTQEEAPSIDQWDLSPGQLNIRTLLIGQQVGDRTGWGCGREERR